MSRLVVKVGGAVAEASAAAILELADAGNEVCVVHGAGPQITEEMERFGIEVQFVDGLRVTSRAGLAVVRSSFGAVNAALCSAVGARAVPLFGDEIGLHAVQIAKLGLVGGPLPSRPAAVLDAFEAGLVPVVAPLGVAENRVGPLNVNADEAATALAVGLGADRILFVTDVAGLILDGEVVDAIGADAARALLDSGLLEGGIVPKLRAAAAAARDGVHATIGRTAVTA